MIFACLRFYSKAVKKIDWMAKFFLKYLCKSWMAMGPKAKTLGDRLKEILLDLQVLQWKVETHFPFNSHFGGKLWFKYIQGNPNLWLLVAVQCMLTKFCLTFILFMSRIQACAANLRLEQQVQAADLLQCCRYEKLSCWQLLDSSMR